MFADISTWTLFPALSWFTLHTMATQSWLLSTLSRSSGRQLCGEERREIRRGEEGRGEEGRGEKGREDGERERGR